VLHTLTDSLWLKRRGTTEADVVALCDEITRATGIEMSLEGIYNWVIFLPSKVNSKRPVACRYCGVFSDGRLKLRGLACRRPDTPEFIKEVQWELLAIVSKTKKLRDRAKLIREAECVLQNRIREIEQGRVDPKKLLVKRTLIKETDDYRVEARTALAARQLREAGVKVHPGERVRYVINNARAKDRWSRVQAEEARIPGLYDVGAYSKMLKVAADEVMFCASLK
jgi:DNA polymerase II